MSKLTVRANARTLPKSRAPKSSHPSTAHAQRKPIDLDKIRAQIQRIEDRLDSAAAAAKAVGKHDRAWRLSMASEALLTARACELWRLR